MNWYEPMSTTKHNLLIMNLAATNFGLTGTLSCMLDFFETSLLLGRQFHFSLDGWIHGDWSLYFDDILGQSVSNSKTGVVIPTDFDIKLSSESLDSSLKWTLYEDG